MRSLSTIIKLRIGLLFQAESCANVLLLRCGVKRKTAPKADFAGHFGLYHEQMAWILPRRKAADPYGAGRRNGTA